MPTPLNQLTRSLPEIILGDDNVLAFTQRFDINYSSYHKWMHEPVGITSRSNEKIVRACGIDLIASIRHPNTLIISDRKWFNQTFPGAIKRAQKLGYTAPTGYGHHASHTNNTLPLNGSAEIYNDPSARMKTNIPIHPVSRQSLKNGQLCSIIRENDEYICGYAFLRSKDILLKSKDGNYQCKIPFTDIKAIYPQEEA